MDGLWDEVFLCVFFCLLNGMECVQRMIVVDDKYEEAQLSRARALSLDDEPGGHRLVVVVVAEIMKRRPWTYVSCCVWYMSFRKKEE